MAAEAVRKKTTKKATRKTTRKVAAKAAAKKTTKKKTRARKAPTPVAEKRAAEQASNILLYSGLGVVGLILIASIIIGMLGDGAIEVADVMKERKASATPEEQAEMTLGEQESQSARRSRSLVPAEVQRETPPPAPELDPTASSTDESASSTDAVASSTDAVAEEVVEVEESTEEIESSEEVTSEESTEEPESFEEPAT